MSTFLGTLQRWLSQHLKIDEDTQTSRSLSSSSSSSSSSPSSSSSLTHSKVSLFQLFRLLLSEIKLITLSLIAISIASHASMSLPDCVGQIIDIISSSSSGGNNNSSHIHMMERIKGIGLRMVGLLAVGAVSTGAHTAWLELAGQRLGMTFRKRLFANIIQQDIAFFDHNTSGELANRLSQDVHEVAEHLVENVSELAQSTAQAVSAIGQMMVLSPQLCGTVVGVVPTLGLTSLLYSRKVKKLSEHLLDLLSTSTHFAAERFSEIRTVRSFAAEKREVATYSRMMDASYYSARLAALLEAVFVAANYLSGQAALVIVVGVGARMVAQNKVTVGVLTSFCLYASHLAESSTDIADSIGGILKAQGAASRVFALLTRKPGWTTKGTLRPPSFHSQEQGKKLLVDISDPQKIPSSSSNSEKQLLVAFEDVWFGYDDNNNSDNRTDIHSPSPSPPPSPSPSPSPSLVLRGVNLELYDGEIVAVTGRSGSGKSTILGLLQLLYGCSKGRIVAGNDRVNVCEMDGDEWRRTLGVVRQEPLLFSCSIRDNIAYANPEASEEEIKEAASTAAIHEFVESLPHKYDTVLAERGLSLSGGQKQRLAIARALLVNPSILVLDEATSALDTDTESLLTNSLTQWVRRKHRAMLMITHHHATLQRADRVIQIHQGQVVPNRIID